MASTLTKKRARRAPAARGKPAPRRVTIDIERVKELVKQAVREVLEERERVPAPRVREIPLAGKSREEIIALALQAEGSWKESEGTGTSVEIVRRLRDEWKHRP